MLRVTVLLRRLLARATVLIAIILLGKIVSPSVGGKSASNKTIDSFRTESTNKVVDLVKGNSSREKVTSFADCIKTIEH